MTKLKQSMLDDFISYLKNDKFKNKILDLKLVQCTDNNGDYIYIDKFLIKKSLRGLGYGSAIIHLLIKFAKEHNVRLLFDMNINYKPIQSFYLKNGFTLIKNDLYYLVYYPN
ncbi:MAG: GNAT family N-acetyltransferase [bacterium]